MGYEADMDYKAPPVGNLIVCIIYDIDPKILKNNVRLERTLEDALKKDGFNIVGGCNYAFEPQGFTDCKLLEESHAAIHTSPEYNSLVFIMYSCRGPGDGKKTLDFIKKELKSSKILFCELDMPIGIKYEDLETFLNKKPLQFKRGE